MGCESDRSLNPCYRTRIKPTRWKWLDENPVYPQERFAYHKRPFWPVLHLKRIGLPCCTLFSVIVTCLLQIILLPNYLLPTISVLAEKTLLKTAYHFLLLLIGFNTLTYRKDYDRSPILVGHPRSALVSTPYGYSYTRTGPYGMPSFVLSFQKRLLLIPSFSIFLPFHFHTWFL